MNNKKGFVFVETLIVVAVLTVSLMMIYSSYSALIIKEKSRISYNDSVYLYRTYYLSQYFKTFQLDSVKQSVDQVISDSNRRNFIAAFGCNREDIFGSDTENKSFCEYLVNDMHVTNLYLTYKDLGFLQNCTTVSGDCEILMQVNSNLADYIRTIGGASSKTKNILDAYNSGYRIIVEFREKKDGSFCDQSSDDCKYYYATISLGDL